jgi:predicted enzyme related to lactoylglutathione lyase
MVGKFVWVELLTSDVEAAAAFYGDVIGWSCSEPGTRDYRHFTIDGHSAAGLMLLPDVAKAQGARPSWFGYISTPDVDADVKAIVAAGGTLFREAETLAGIGRFAVISDPQGAVFGLWTDLSGAVHAEIPPMTHGHVGWHELFADDVDKAMGFYAEKFGWTKAEAMDMGPMGVYQMFATGGHAVGGMMRRPENIPQPFWNYYLTVPALDAAIAQVEKSGGKIVNGPMEVPGGTWIVQCFDPQGAFFSLVAAKR